MRETKKLVIFLPQAQPSVSVEFDESFFNAYMYLLRAVNEDALPFEIKDILVYRAKTFPIDANRNECATRFVEGIPVQGGGVFRADISIWIDLDHELPQDAFVRLLNHNRPIMLGVYYLKVPKPDRPFYPVLFRQRTDKEGLYKAVMDFPKESIFEVDMAGMGAACIHREVFEKLSMPYFRYMRHPDGSANPDSTWKNEAGIEDVSEDVWFWKQVKEKTNYPILVDPMVQFGHVGKMVFDKHMYRAWLIDYKRRLIEVHGQEKFDKTWGEMAVAEPYKEVKIYGSIKKPKGKSRISKVS